MRDTKIPSKLVSIESYPGHTVDKYFHPEDFLLLGIRSQLEKFLEAKKNIVGGTFKVEISWESDNSKIPNSPVANNPT